MDKIWYSRVKGPIKQKLLDQIDETLPTSVRKLVAIITNDKLGNRFKKLAVEKATENDLLAQVKKSLGAKVHLLEDIEEATATPKWQVPTSKVTKEDLAREHEAQMHDSVHDRSMTISQVTKDGVAYLENIGHFGTSSAEAKYFGARKGLWKSALSAEVPTLEELEKSDLELLETTISIVRDTGNWPSGTKSVENLLVQVMHLLPNQLERMLACLPDEWENNLSNMVSLFSRAKILTNAAREEEDEGSFLTAQTMNDGGKGKTILEELYVFTKEYMPQTSERASLLREMENELPSLSNLGDERESKAESYDTDEDDVFATTPEAVSVSKPSVTKAARKLSFSSNIAEEGDADDESQDAGLSIYTLKKSISTKKRESGSWEQEPNADVQALLRKIAGISSDLKSKPGSMVAVDLEQLMQLMELAKGSTSGIKRYESVLSSDHGIGSSVNDTLSHRDSLSSTEDPMDLLGLNTDIIIATDC